MRAAGHGRFKNRPDPVAEKFSRSVHFDQRLARHDLEGSRAHAAVLTKAGILSRKEAAEIRRGWTGSKGRFSKGSFGGRTPWRMCI